MQKNILILGLVCLLMFGLVAASASADISVTGPLSLGDDRQRASNPSADDDDDKDEYVSGTLTITNTGTAAITSLVLDSVVPSGSFTTTDLDVTATFVKTALAVGESTTVTIKARIPEKLDAIDKTKDDIKESEFKVADLVFKDSAASTATAVLKMQRENQLEIDKLKVCVNDKCKNVNDGDNIENVKPGDKIELRITVENKYSDNDREDVDLKDVEVSFEIDDDDFSEDDDEELNTLRADDKDELIFSFDVEDDVKDGSYGLMIRTFGRDENSAFHGHQIDVDLEVDRKTHDITIRRTSISPTQLTCGVSDFSARVTVGITNLGQRDEDDVVIEVSNDELGVLERLESIELNEDDSTTETLSFKIDSEAKPGVYRVEVKSFFANTAQSDEEEVTLTIPDCSDFEKDEEEDTVVTPPTTPTVVPVQPTTPQPPIVRPRASSGSSMKEFTESNTYLVLLVALTVAVLLALVFLVSRLMVRR